MEKRHLSYTQISMFLRCPKQYEFRYMQGLKKPPSGAMVQSRVWHETLEKNYKQKIKTDTDLPLNDMQEFFSARYDEAFSDEEIIFDTDSNPAKLKDQGVSIVETHHRIIAPTVKPIAVEEKFQISLGEDFPFELMGIWDIIEADGTIVDNKAYKRTPLQNDFDKDLQFTIYSLGYRATKQCTEKALRMDAVIKTKQTKVVQLHTRRTNEECRWVLGLIERIGQAIKGGIFFPNPNGWHCNKKFCGYYDQCKKGSQSIF